jgi:hypothetical protein
MIVKRILDDEIKNSVMKKTPYNLLGTESKPRRPTPFRHPHQHLRMPFQIRKQLCIPKRASFDDFGHAVEELAWRESLEGFEVGEDGVWLPECSDQVFALLLS